MDALVPALVAALLAGVGDRPARLAALLCASGNVGRVIAGFVVGHGLAIAISVAGALVIAPAMAPNAKSLLLAIALMLAGVNAAWRRKAPGRSLRRPFVSAATGSFATGDSTAFLAFGLAVKGSAPILAGVGALTGALALATVAAMAGRDWERLPLTLLSRVASVLLCGTGVIVALDALRLI